MGDVGGGKVCESKLYPYECHENFVGYVQVICVVMP